MLISSIRAYHVLQVIAKVVMESVEVVLGTPHHPNGDINKMALTAQRQPGPKVTTFLILHYK
jgi:hypothetical protein